MFVLRGWLGVPPVFIDEKIGKGFIQERQKIVIISIRLGDSLGSLAAFIFELHINLLPDWP